MRNSNLIKLICLILSIFMAVSLLGACSGNKNVNSSEPSTSSEDSSSSDDTAEDEEFDEPVEEDEESDEWDDYWDEEEEEEEEEESEYIPETLYVYNNEAPINSQYRGMSASVYHAYGHMLDDTSGRAYTDEMMNLELSRLEDAGVHYARTRYTTEWAWDGKINGWNWESPRMKYYWDYCRDLAKHNVEILQQVGWHLGCITGIDGASITEHPYVMEGKNYGDRYGESVGYDFSKCPNNDYKEMAVESLRLAEAHVQLLMEAKKRGINNITHLMYFTEPSSEVTESTAKQYGYEPSKAGRTPDEYIFVVQTIQQKLKDRGVYNWVKHVGPNQGSIKHGDGLLRYMLERGHADMFDIWTAHFYPDATDASNNVYYDIIDPVFESYVQPLKDVDIFQKEEFWVDEFYCRSSNAKLGVDSPWAGLQMAVGGIIAQQRGISNISLWQIFDQLWTDQTNSGGEFMEGIHVCGSAPSLFVSSIPRSQYYSTSLFAKYHGYADGKAYRTNNAELQDMASDIHIGAAQLADGSWTITVVNAGIDDYQVTVEFEKAIYQTLYRHLNTVTETIPTTAAHLADADKTFANVKDKFIDIVPAASVAIYTGIKG